MRSMIAASVGFAALIVTMRSEAAPPPAAPKGVMTVPGKLLFQDDFAKPISDKDWPVGKGKWECVDGAVRVSELPADMHAAVKRHPLAFHNAIIQYEFKLDGGKQTTLSLNKAKGHACRVVINANGFSVKKDKDKKTNDAGVVLDTCTVAIKPGEWHAIQVEILGKEMLAQLDGKHIAFGSHSGIDVDMASVGLTVAGSTVSFKNLRVWEATASKDWTATRERLAAQKKK